MSCAHYPVNSKLLSSSSENSYRFNSFRERANSDSLFICLTFSGGGTRAAALAYGVLSKLASIPISTKEGTKRILDEVDCLSSVSGGSFTAAYYALFGEQIFQDFPRKFLYRDVEGELFRKAFLDPLNLARMASPYFGRIDLAAEFYDDEVFDRKTFADLLSLNRRPT